MLEAICVSEEDDVQRWQSLGVERERIRRTGSIKFDESAGGVSRVADFRDLLAPLGVTPETPIVVAGSTHAGEELILGRIFVALREEFPDLLLIIVPRHVERTGDILRELGSIGVVIARRTELSGAGHRPDILLVDTTGELRDWYSLATAVFVGKSLTSIGGQNPAEPAALGRAVVVGPHMENFAAVVDLLLRAGGLAQIQDEGGLASELRLLLRDSPLRESRAAAAQAALTTHKGATARTSEVIAEVLRGSSVHSDASVRLD
jgi:3-deoxy-D-manno-octulosonic-acid transferase